MASPADRIFHNGPILTMEEDMPRAEAVAVSGGRIAAAGTAAEVFALRGPATEVTDLAGRALLPGFVDGHGHLAKVADSLHSANLAGPPVGEVVDIPSLLDTLRAFIRGRRIPPGGWVRGRGYDPAFLAEGRHPTRDDLDRVSREHPIHLTHVSGHLVSANSLALALAGIGADSADPPGGIIRRADGTNEPNGVLEENAMAAFSTGVIPMPSSEDQLAALEEAQRIYASQGITTAQEGAMFPAEQALLQEAAAAGRLRIDVAGYAFWAQAGVMLSGAPAGAYQGRFRNAGLKLMLDGSPQGGTAWFTKPYHTTPEGQLPDYRGYPAMPDERANAVVEEAFANGWQVLSHCNGDAAADQFIAAVERAAATHPSTDRRPVMVHAQTVREDQLDRMATLGILPSFFASHVYYWGDYHREVVMGPERAARISPMRSARRRGLRFNIHNDSPVVPPDILRLVWSAAARRTRSGELLGPDQAVTVEEALRAVTLDAAFAHFEDREKGSLAPGKLADLVILSDDPTEVPLEDIQSIRVEATLKDGRLIYGDF